MISLNLNEARQYEEKEGPTVPVEDRPLFHLTPYIGWMNDPNGFSFYNGKYHLFYQYFPYAKRWGPMHWGHAESEDLLTWKHLPAALAPDSESDMDGCFSGSALTLADGRQMLMYTGVKRRNIPGRDLFTQQQCIAFLEDGEYVKYPHNPVLAMDQVPEDSNEFDFRDPKIWRNEDGTYGCVCVNCDQHEHGRVLYYTSPDAIHWTYESTLLYNDFDLGRMWECPDFFVLDGQQVLLLSPQDMWRDGKYYNGNNVSVMLGKYDPETKTFIKESDEPLDCGIDFYATQTLETNDGRRIVVAWMQNWDTISFTKRYLHWFGQMCLPRELFIRDGKVCQRPVREFDAHRINPVTYENVVVEEFTSLEGISGRIGDFTVEISTAENVKEFEVRFAQDPRHYTSLIYLKYKQQLVFDRSHSGTRRAVIHTRNCQVEPRDNKLKLRIILDRYSVEVFVNDGEKAMTSTIYTPRDCSDITFHCDGKATISVTKYDLDF